MKKLFLGTVVFLAALGVVFVAGPRAVVDPSVAAPEIQPDVAAYIAASEAVFTDILPGAEKTIFWADSSRQRTPVAVVYLHGFSATRQEVRPLCDTLAARLDANLFYTRLAGHGRTPEALGAATAEDWLRDGLEAMTVGRQLGERVLLVGTSTGATLAAWLAARPHASDDLLAVVLISPNFHPKDRTTRFLLWPWGSLIARALVGPYHEWTPKNDEQGRYWTTRYPTEALVTMMSLVDLVEETDLGRLQAPTLVFYSPGDQVIDPAEVEDRFTEIGAGQKRLVSVASAGDPSNHVLAGAILSPENTGPVADTVIAFVRPFAPSAEGQDEPPRR